MPRISNTQRNGKATSGRSVSRGLGLTATLAAAALLAACTPEAEGPRPGTNLVSLDQALQVFDKTCGATYARGFEGADAAMRSQGLTVPSGQRLASPAFAMSGRISDFGGRPLCTLQVTGSGDSAAIQDQLAAKFGRPRFRDQVAPGVLTYRRSGGRKMLLLLQGGRGAAGTTRYQLGYAPGV